MSQKLPDISINGDTTHRLPNNANLQIPGIDGERVVMEMDERGVQIATASACHASADDPSHVLLAIGCSRADAEASIRISIGRPTTQDDIDAASALLADTVLTLRRLV